MCVLKLPERVGFVALLVFVLVCTAAGHGSGEDAAVIDICENPNVIPQLSYKKITFEDSKLVSLGLGLDDEEFLAFGGSTFIFRVAKASFYPFDTSKYWFAAHSKVEPVHRYDHLMINVAPGVVFMYGGTLMDPGAIDAHHNWLFTRTNRFDRAHSSNLMVGKTRPRQPLGTWGNVVFDGDVAPPRRIAKASVASLGGGRFIIFGGVDGAGQPIQNFAWVGEYTNHSRVGPTITWQRLSRPVDNTWPPTVFDAGMAALGAGKALLFGGDKSADRVDNRDTFVIHANGKIRDITLTWEKIESTPTLQDPDQNNALLFAHSNFGLTAVEGMPLLYNPSALLSELELSVWKMNNDSGAITNYGEGEMWAFDVNNKTWNPLKMAKFFRDEWTNLGGTNRVKFMFAAAGRHIVYSGGAYVDEDYEQPLKDTVYAEWLTPTEISYFFDDWCATTPVGGFCGDGFKDITASSGPLPPRMRYSMMASHGSVVYMYGGVHDNQRSQSTRDNENDFWVFNKVEDSWIRADIGGIPPQLKLRDRKMVAIDHPTLGKFLLGNGRGLTVAETWLLDISHTTWEQVQSTFPILIDSRWPYQLCPINSGAVSFGGHVLIDGVRTKNENVYYFTCDSNIADCKWKKLSLITASPRRLFQTPREIIISSAISSNAVAIFPEPEAPCTDVFQMQSQTTGEWVCVGKAAPQYADIVVSFQPFGAGLAGAVGLLKEGLFYFVYNKGNPNASVWIATDKVRPPNAISFPSDTVVSGDSGDRMILFGGVYRAVDVYSDKTLVLDLGCPPGYEFRGIVGCNKCPKGTYKDNIMGACVKCPGQTWSPYEGASSKSDCNKQCHPESCSTKGTRSMKVKELACTCMCHDEYSGITCATRECTYGIFRDGPECEINPLTLGFAAIFLLILSVCTGLAIRERKVKEKMSMSSRQLDLYTRLLDQTKVDIAEREEELRGIQEGITIMEEDLTLSEKIGEGTYAEVFRGTWRGLDNVNVAVKVMHVHPESGDSVFDEKETKILQRLRHPNLVLLFGAGTMQDGKQFLVTEYVSLGDLSSVLLEEMQKGIPPFPVSRRFQYGIDIAKGMEFLHTKQIIHRDLKSANVLVTSSGHCKITDFGVSRQLARRSTSFSSWQGDETVGIEMTSYLGSIAWMAPEIMEGRTTVYSEKVDVFSFGMVLYELITSRRPYMLGPVVRNADDVFHYLTRGVLPTVPSGNLAPACFTRLMKECCTVKSTERPSFTLIRERLTEEYTDETALEQLINS